MRIAWSVEARADLQALFDYLEKNAPETWPLIARRIRHSEQIILTLPKAARHDPETDTYDKFVPRTRLIMTYRIVGEGIQIIRLWHTSRDPATKH